MCMYVCMYIYYIHVLIREVQERRDPVPGGDGLQSWPSFVICFIVIMLISSSSSSLLLCLYVCWLSMCFC